jgi:CBS domain containing-hemolysin-like protein
MEPPEPGSGSVIVGLVAVFALVLANAFFVAAEFALVGARKTRLEELGKAGDRKATLAAKAVQSLDRYISATQLGITLASLGLGWMGKPALAHLISGAFRWLPDSAEAYATDAVAIVIAFSIITVLHIVLGELAPKAVALLYPEAVSGWVVVPLMGFNWLMAGPIKLLNGTANAVLRLFRIKTPSGHERVHSPDEIRMLVEQSQEFGTLGAQDARMLEGVFEFSEKTAEEVMTPRTDVVAISAEATVEAAADVVAESERSRYPVYHDTLDEIAGIVHAKDILRGIRQTPGAKVSSLVRTPLFVPGTREVEDVLADMKRLKTHMAVVLDEYGGTAGVVTMEDLLEEIVGPIVDEFDVAERPASPTGGTRLLDGAMPISEFNSEFEETLSDVDYTTIGGWIFGQLGRLPRVGDRIPVGNHLFEVAEMEGRRVKRVRLLPAETPKPAVPS